MTTSLSTACDFVLPWPLTTLAKLALAPPPPSSGAQSKALAYAEVPAQTSLIAHATILFSGAWKLLFSILVYYFVPIDLAAAAVLSPRWML